MYTNACVLRCSGSSSSYTGVGTQSTQVFYTGRVKSVDQYQYIFVMFGKYGNDSDGTRR